jgi:hypothetical protein
VTWRIYGLRDPRDGVIRYVGITLKTARERLREHVREARGYPRTRNERSKWILSLLSDGVEPVVLCLRDSITNITEACAQEQAWIVYLRSRGLPLTNAKRATFARGSDPRGYVSSLRCAQRVADIVAELMDAAA